MCGRYGFSIKDKKEVYDRFDIDNINFDLKPNYNVAPTQEMPVVERHSPNSLHLRKWGIKPGWSPKVLVNAQSEKVATSNVWKKAFMESRVIIPATHFYEWKRLTTSKQPYLFKLKDQQLFGFAGLLVKYHDEDKTDKEAYVIITTTPNSLMEPIHNRMPCILNKDDEDDWLNPDSSVDQLQKLFEPYPSKQIEAYPISPLVNKVSYNEPNVTEPFEEKKLF